MSAFFWIAKAERDPSRPSAAPDAKLDGCLLTRSHRRFALLDLFLGQCEIGQGVFRWRTKPLHLCFQFRRRLFALDDQQIRLGTRIARIASEWSRCRELLQGVDACAPRDQVVWRRITKHIDRILDRTILARLARLTPTSEEASEDETNGGEVQSAPARFGGGPI